MGEQFRREYLCEWVEPNEETITKTDVWQEIRNLCVNDVIVKHVYDHYRYKGHDEGIYSFRELQEKYHNEMVLNLIRLLSEENNRLQGIVNCHIERNNRSTFAMKE